MTIPVKHNFNVKSFNTKLKIINRVYTSVYVKLKIYVQLIQTTYPFVSGGLL